MQANTSFAKSRWRFTRRAFHKVIAAAEDAKKKNLSGAELGLGEEDIAEAKKKYRAPSASK